MNRLWIRLSFAFFGVIASTVVVIFSILFALSWLTPEPTPEEFYNIFIDEVEPYVVTFIIDGKSDDEIHALIGGSDAQLQTLIEELRAQGWQPGMVEDLSFGRIAGDYLYELFSPDFMIVVLIGTILGMIASMVIAKQLTRPLAELTQASYALSQQDLSRRVNVRGTGEINQLATSFNEMADRLERAEEVRQNMLADVSHELRTPLAGLEGTLRATLDGVFDLSEEHVGNLYGQTQHLTRLVDDLHLLARAEAHRLQLEKSSIDLTSLLRDLVSGFDVLAQNKKIRLDAQVAPRLMFVGDAIRIRQIFSNLLSNALRHTPEGGQIVLAAVLDLNAVTVTVQDDGEGIDADYLPHLFDRFYRVDPSRSRESGGTGLGLAITKALVEAHGGTISAESEGSGKGSQFIVRFSV